MEKPSRYGGGPCSGIGGGALAPPGAGTLELVEWVGRAGWLSSSRSWRRAAGASPPPGAASRYFLYASTAWPGFPAARYASPRPNSACGKLGERLSARLNSPTAASGFCLSRSRYAELVTAATPLGCSLSASSMYFCALAVLPCSSARSASATSCS